MNWPLEAALASSSTAMISVSRGPAAVRAVCTTRSTVSATRLVSAPRGRSVSESWHTKRRRVSAWRAEPAWMVVYPFTPDDNVSSSGRASRSRTSPTMATSGAMRRNPATRRRRSMPGRSGRCGRVWSEATLGSAMSTSNTSSATTTRSAGSSSAAQHESSVVLPEPGGPAKTIEARAWTHARRNVARCSERLPRATRSASEVKGVPVNLRMLTSTCPPRLSSPWMMCSRAPSGSWASCRPSAGSSLRCEPEASSRILVSVRTTWASSWKTSSW